MLTLICIDDTDNIDNRGTGDIASENAEEMELGGWGACSYITRHQLFVHPVIGSHLPGFIRHWSLVHWQRVD